MASACVLCVYVKILNRNLAFLCKTNLRANYEQFSPTNALKGGSICLLKHYKVFNIIQFNHSLKMTIIKKKTPKPKICTLAIIIIWKQQFFLLILIFNNCCKLIAKLCIYIFIL